MQDHKSMQIFAPYGYFKNITWEFTNLTLLDLIWAENTLKCPESLWHTNNNFETKRNIITFYSVAGVEEESRICLSRIVFQIRFIQL